MKGIWLGIVGAIVVAIIAGVALQAVEQSSEQRYSTENVRLSN